MRWSQSHRDVFASDFIQFVFGRNGGFSIFVWLLETAALKLANRDMDPAYAP
jgi:hypothetical protein